MYSFTFVGEDLSHVTVHKKVIDFSQYYVHCISISITNDSLVRCTGKPYQETEKELI